jgi:ABC-type dipeptide/oligopeptide/nickel transport system ATPase subunit
LKGKNLLVYGNNGSGKSSLYWALYTLLQCSEKDIGRVNEYFAIYDEANESTFQSLRNVFSTETESFIEIELQGEQPIRISQDNIDNVKNLNVIKANKASDFISYKLLNNFYNSTHKQQLNLWKVFERDIFSYCDMASEHTFYDILNELYNQLPKQEKDKKDKFYARNSTEYKQFQQKINNFNQELNELISKINIQANKILEEKFEINDVQIVLDYSEQLQWDKNKNHVFSTPEIKLSVKVKKENIFISNHRPQSFLNEAALTRIAISIRFGALFTRLAMSDWKILVLDDMLISLDMSNRMIVSKIILEDKDLQEFQKIILTHDKGFFDILKSQTNTSDWEYLEFSKDEKLIDSKPVVKTNKTELEKAKEFFEANEFDACANYLRKEVEKILKHYLNKELKNEFETLSSFIGRVKNKIKSERLARFNKLFKRNNLPLEKLKEDFEQDETLTPEIKGHLKTLQNHLFNFLIQENKKEINILNVLGELEVIKDRILNPGSHGNSIPLYSQELQEAIVIVEQLHRLLNPVP